MSSGFRYYVEVAGRPPIELPEGEISVGRSRSCTVQIADTTVSRQHVTLRLERGAVRMKDLGSSNGTFVNGSRVSGEVPIADGDRVIVGEAQMVFRIVAPAVPEVDATMKVDIDKVFAEAIDRVDRAEFHPAPGAVTVPQSPLAPLPPAPPLAAPLSAPQAAIAAAVTQPPTPSPRSTPTPPPPPPRTAMPPAPAAPPAAPAPAARSTPPPPPPAAMPPRAAPSPPPLAPAGGGELLPSIKEIELQQVPAPGPRKASPTPRPGAVPQVAASGAPAGFWIRVAQALLDEIPVVVLVVVSFVGIFLRLPFLGLLVMPLQLAYAFFLLVYAPAMWGATPGMRLLKLAIVSPENRAGQGLGWPKALLRMVGHFVCGMTLGIGYLLVAFTSKKQGLHDMIANTQVVRR